MNETARRASCALPLSFLMTELLSRVGQLVNGASQPSPLQYSQSPQPPAKIKSSLREQSNPLALQNIQKSYIHLSLRARGKTGVGARVLRDLSSAACGSHNERSARFIKTWSMTVAETLSRRALEEGSSHAVGSHSCRG